MPPDHLTGRPDHIATMVEAVLSGAPAEATAATAGIRPADLDAAVETYRAGGLAALQHRHDAIWFHALVEPTDWTTTESTFRDRIAPRLDQLDHAQATWWFLRKHPYWRLRIRTADRHVATALLDDLVAASVIARWTPGIYEPETAAFGGSVAMDIAHDLFCADSRGVLAYTRHDPPPVGRRELSLLLIRALQDGVGLDWFEAADVFDRVAQMRPSPPAGDDPRIERLAGQMRPLLALPAQARSALFAGDGPLAAAAPMVEAFMAAGRQVCEAAAAGRLDRGVRAVLAHMVIFHWNRLGLSANSQAILARAATVAILPGADHG